MTTPTPPGFNTASSSGSRILGGNDLQTAIDNLTQAVQANTSAVQQSAGASPGGQSVPIGNTGQTSTFGSFPAMASVASHFSSGIPANYATTPTGGQGNGQGGWGQATTNPAGTTQSAVGSMGSMATSTLASAGQFGNQITMNQYAAMSMLGMSPGTSMGAGMSAMYSQAFGSYGKNVNAIAMNPADAAQMYSNLQGIAASPNVMSTAQGRAGYGAAAGFGVANPALGGAGASAAAAQLYSGQTSLAMRQLGYGATPRAGMGQANPLSMAQTAQAMFQRWYGSGSVSMSTLNAGLANNGKVQLNLQALGLDPTTMGPALQMYDKLFQQGVSASSAQAMLNDAAQNRNYNGQSAQKLLSNKYGIPTSDLQKLKDTTAVQTSNTSGEMGGFDSALSQATTTVQKFDTAIGAILKMTGLGTMLGAAHGFSGAMGAVGGTVGRVFGDVTGMLSRFGGAAGGSGNAISSIGGGTSALGSIARTTAGGTNGGKPGSSVNNVSKQVQMAVKDAESQLGKPYQWGGDNPTTGFDCSGLVEWAYRQAGVSLPRTSQAQWDALKNRSVPLDKVQAGDLVFAAGSDGSGASPGHVGMMVSGKQLIQAPATGQDIQIIAYSPSAWQHAARPTGSMTNVKGGSASASVTNGSGPATSASTQGNSGLGVVGGTGGSGGLGLAPGSYGSSEEVSNIQAALLGGGLTGGGGMTGGPSSGVLGLLGSASTGNGQGSSKGGNTNVSTAGGGGASANQALARKMAQQMYGWTGSQWTQGLLPLWTQESGFRADAQNPQSTAYGIAQFLDSTWGPYGPKTGNPGMQIKYGLEYIHSRYGNPLNAEAHERAYNWYGTGTTNAMPGTALVGDRGPELVRLSGGQQIYDAQQTSDMLKGNTAKPAQAPWNSGTAQQLMLANQPQNQSQRPANCNVNLQMPQGAIVIHTNGSATDVSNNVRQIMAGISQAMADDETLKKIMAGVTS